MENLNTTFFSLRSINNDGQIRHSRFARSTVSSKTFERAHKLVAPVLLGRKRERQSKQARAAKAGRALPGL
jgi:aspartate carbamoyltransferase catalytic subunit